MEPIAHTLTGVAIARALPDAGVSKRAAFWTAVAAANLPDADLLLYLTHGEHGYLIHHRGLTHSVFALALLPPLIAAVSARVSRAPFRALWLLATLAMASHLLLDVTTSFGTMLLAPLSSTRFALPWFFIVDPVFWLTLGIPLWLSRRPGARVRRLATAGLAALAVYMGGCCALYLLADQRAHDLAAAEGVEAATVHTWPTPLWPTVRSTIATDDNLAHHAVIDLLASTDTYRAHWPTNLADPAVAFALGTAPGRGFAWWAGDPIARVGVDPDSGHVGVEIRDARYWSAVLDEPTFAMVFELEPLPGGQFRLVEWRWRNRGRGPPAPGLGPRQAREQTALTGASAP